MNYYRQSAADHSSSLVRGTERHNILYRDVHSYSSNRELRKAPAELLALKFFSHLQPLGRESE